MKNFFRQSQNEISGIETCVFVNLDSIWKLRRREGERGGGSQAEFYEILYDLWVGGSRRILRDWREGG